MRRIKPCLLNLLSTKRQLRKIRKRRIGRELQRNVKLRDRENFKRRLPRRKPRKRLKSRLTLRLRLPRKQN